MLYTSRTTRATLSTLGLLVALTGCNPDDADDPADTGEQSADTAIDPGDTAAKDAGDTGPVEDSRTDDTADGGPRDTADGMTRDTSDTATGDTSPPDTNDTAADPSDTTVDTSDTSRDTAPPLDTTGDTMAADTAPDTAVPVDTGPDATPDTGGSNLTIDWCRLQFPKTITVTAGNATPTVYGRAYVAGCTTGTMECSPLQADLGWGSSAVDPSQNPAMYNWAQASYNSGHPSGSTSGNQRNNDEHQATFTPQTKGTFKFTYRFSVDGGQSWTYCDTNGPPFETAKLGDLTVN